MSLEAPTACALHTGAGSGRRRALPPIYPDRAAREKSAAALRAKLASAAPGARRAEICSGLADLLLDAGDQEEAGRLYDEALRSPESGASPATQALILQRAGRRQRMLGERGRALRFFEKSL